MLTAVLYARHGKPSRAEAEGTGIVFATGYGPVTSVLQFHKGVLLGGITLVLALAAAAQTELSTLLSELMSRQASREILDVACAVDLEASGGPAMVTR